jgi:hypothetical protein
MWLLVFLLYFVLGVLSLRGVRWAYIAKIYSRRRRYLGRDRRCLVLE